MEWFKNNHMKANVECHLLVTIDTDVNSKFGEFDVKNSKEENIFGELKSRSQAFCRNSCFFSLQTGKPCYMHSQES